MEHHIAAWVKRIRESRYLTQSLLGDILGIGQSTVADIEAGRRQLRFIEYQHIVFRLCVSPEERFPLMGKYIYPEWCKDEFAVPDSGCHLDITTVDPIFVQQYYHLFGAYISEKLRNRQLPSDESELEKLYLPIIPI